MGEDIVLTLVKIKAVINGCVLATHAERNEISKRKMKELISFLNKVLEEFLKISFQRLNMECITLKSKKKENKNVIREICLKWFYLDKKNMDKM